MLTLDTENATNVEALHIQRQSNGLAASEMETLTTLMKGYMRIMLLRMRSYSLLKQRSHER